jgi:hypothetical protein
MGSTHVALRSKGLKLPPRSKRLKLLQVGTMFSGEKGFRLPPRSTHVALKNKRFKLPRGVRDLSCYKEQPCCQGRKV